MEKNKRITNVLLVIIVILVIGGCALAYFYFTKDKTKPIIDPEEKKFAYVTGYEIVANEVVPILMKAKKDGTISKLREYTSFRQAIIELAE